MNAEQEKALCDLRRLGLRFHKTIVDLNNLFNSQWATIKSLNTSLKTFGCSVKSEIQYPIEVRHAENMMQVIPKADIQKIQFYLNLLPVMRHHEDVLQDTCKQQLQVIMQQRYFLNQHESKSVLETGNYELHFGGPSVEVLFEDESLPIRVIVYEASSSKKLF